MRTPRTSAAVRIDPATLVDHPLSKERIAVYNSGLVPLARYERDAAHIAAVRPESLRIDLGWGAEWMPWTREVVRVGQNGLLEFDFDETDRLARLLNDVGVRPYWSYCYVPEAARELGDDWRTMARDDGPWVNTVRAYVDGLRRRGVSVGYHEVYNEPDLRDERTGDPTFYAGGLEDYLDLYRATAAGIREAEPSARVGGPALAVAAVHADWLDAFCRMVVAESLPLDFLSFHHYGHFGLEGTLRTVREVVAAYPALQDVELHLNEYNAFSIDYPRGGLQDTHFLASAFAADIPRLLGFRDLTRTHWAQFLDSGEGNFSGMVSIDGLPKPVYAVYHFYQNMPVDRVAVDVDGPPGVGGVAGATSSLTAAILWNRHFTDLDVDMVLCGVHEDIDVVVIDGDGVSAEEVLALHDGHAHLAIPAGGVALVHTGAPLLDSGPRVAWGMATRAKQAGWSDLDEASLTFRFGMARQGSCSFAADVGDDVAIDDWQVQARTAQGAPVEASVSVRVDDGESPVERTLTGGGLPAWDQVLPRLPVAERRRVVVVAAAPAGAFVTVSPRASSVHRDVPTPGSPPR